MASQNEIDQDLIDSFRSRPEMQAHLASVVESSDDAIISKTLQGIITTWNKGAERLFGYTSAEIVGKSILMLIPENRKSEEPEILRKIAAGEKIDHYETVRMRKDGTLLDISITVSPIRDASGKIVGASKIARNITVRKRIEAERDRLLELERHARTEAERLNVMKDEFLSTLSHELRTPLNAILGWSQVLRGRMPTQEELHEGLEVIERSARVQTQLIEDLLDMSRIISGKIRLDVQEVDLQDVIKTALATVRHSAESKDIRLQSVLDPLAGPVMGDPGRLQQCFWNLLSNAIKFTPKGGKVQVTLSRINSHVEVCVIDNGQGIAPDFLPHVFERFCQADSSSTRHHGGLGLGLSIVKSLIELHGGTVRAKSAGVGQGATFCIELPLIAVPREQAHLRSHPRTPRPMPSPIDCPSLEGINILAVDDESDARALIQRVLEDCGARVITAASAEEGMEKLKSHHPAMIISDIGMPEEDGYDFIKRVRALPPEQGGRTPAAALTAFARSEDRTRALLAGYQSHIAKPVEAAELVAVVASLAQRK